MYTNIYHDEPKMDTNMFYIHSVTGFMSTYMTTYNVDFLD